MNQGILGGLKLALSKGESLKQAMMSFYNAGYKREEIEEAARELQREIMEQKEIPQKIKEPLKQKPIQKISKPKKPVQKVSAYGEPTQIKINPPANKEKISEVKQKKEEIVKSPQKIISQKISNYEKTQKPKHKLIIILLIFFLVILLGSLVAVFMFKQELVDFFNKII
jgi:uncharacterized membrane protein